MAGVDHAVRARIGELGRLAHPGHASTLDEDRAVPDDPPRAVEGDDVARVIDLERLALHASAGSLGRVRYREDGTGDTSAQAAKPAGTGPPAFVAVGGPGTIY